MTCKESHRTSKESKKYGSDRQFKENHKTTKNHRSKKWENNTSDTERINEQQNQRTMEKIGFKRTTVNTRLSKEIYITQRKSKRATRSIAM